MNVSSLIPGDQDFRVLSWLRHWNDWFAERWSVSILMTSHVRLESIQNRGVLIGLG